MEVVNDEGGPSQTKTSCGPFITWWQVDLLGTKISCAPVIVQWGWILWNKMFLCICHQVMRANTLKPKILMDLSSCDDGVPFRNKFFCRTCHHAVRVDVVEQKVLVYLPSGDKGGHSCTKNACGPVITWWWWTSWEWKILVHLSSCD